MMNDLDLIVKQYPEDITTLHVYAIGDVHVGSPQFDEQAIRKKIKIIQDDPLAAVCICGDLGDYGLKNAKTNVYQATMQPRQQQEYIYELFAPIADKIAAALAIMRNALPVKSAPVRCMTCVCAGVFLKYTERT